jgi:hypothetical protein
MSWAIFALLVIMAVAGRLGSYTLVGEVAQIILILRSRCDSDQSYQAL